MAKFNVRGYREWGGGYREVLRHHWSLNISLEVHTDGRRPTFLDPGFLAFLITDSQELLRGLPRPSGPPYFQALICEHRVAKKKKNGKNRNVLIFQLWVLNTLEASVTAPGAC